MIGAIARLALLLRSDAEQTVRPYLDDAFYMFSVARNLAHGHGMSVDGVHLTNGIQPLLVLLYTPLFWVTGANDWLAIRLTVILNTMIFIASICMLIRLLGELEYTDQSPSHPSTFGLPPFALGAGIWALSISFFQHTMNGLETGLYSFMLLTVMWLYLRLKHRNDSSILHWSLFGVVLGLTVLTRIDSAILVAVLFAVELFRKNYKHAFAFAFVALGITLPWWIFNYTVFGSLIPISGQAENLWASQPGENLHRMIAAIGDIFCLLFYSSYGFTFLQHAVWTLAAVLLWTFVYTRMDKSARKILAVKVRALLPFFIFSIILVVYYTFFFKAPHFMPRYFFPMRLLWLLVVAIGVPLALTPNRKRVVAALLGIVLLFGIVFSVNRYAQCFGIEREAEFYQMGTWAQEHTNDKIGMLQSGTAGFIAPNVVNLDGKVNRDALEAHKHDTLGSYIRNQHFTYLADWKLFVEDIARIAHNAGANYDSVGYVGRIQLMKLREF